MRWDDEGFDPDHLDAADHADMLLGRAAIGCGLALLVAIIAVAVCVWVGLG